MKTLFKTLTLSIILSVALFGCSKKSDVGTKPLTATTWTISGNTYKGTFTGITNNELLSTDNQVSTGPNIGIQFSGTPTAGTYAAIGQFTSNGELSSTQCYINTSNSDGSNQLYSSGGGTVTITINSGKITASFADVPVGSIIIGPNGSFTYSAAGTVSGTLIEQ